MVRIKSLYIFLNTGDVLAFSELINDLWTRPIFYILRLDFLYFIQFIGLDCFAGWKILVYSTIFFEYVKPISFDVVIFGYI